MGVCPAFLFLQSALPSKGSNEYKGPTPLNRDRPDIKSICSDFEKDDRTACISYWVMG